jgi:hypothetical protein
MMSVLAHQSAFDTICDGGPVLADGADVDEQAGLGIDPSGVNHIRFVVGSAVGVVRIDLKKVVSAGRHSREAEVIFGHVIVFGEEVDGLFRDLEVKVGVPG